MEEIIKKELQKSEIELKKQINEVRLEMKENFNSVNKRLDEIITRSDRVNHNRTEMRELLTKIEKNTSSYRAK
ncbi:hypothetical protein ACRPLQ_25455 [Priestia sp. TRN 1309]|uniref:hypothetical protein n=1 Tax=Priestia sp. TRN 1309 TaxID=3420729 RepID=UPI003D76C2E8